MRPTQPASARELAAFLRHHRAEIVETWRGTARTVRAARKLGEAALVDELPALLLELAGGLEHDDPLDAPPAEGGAVIGHALERLAEGFDLGEMVAEYALLREAILREWRRVAPAPDLAAELALARAIDRATHAAVQLFTEQRDRTVNEAVRESAAAARRSEDRLRFLADAGTILAGSLDVQRLAQKLTDLAVPRIADWCMLDLARPDGTVQAVALSTSDPDPLRVERIRIYREANPIRRDTPYGFATVMATGEPLLLPRVDAEVLQKIRPDEQYVRWVLEAGIRSAMVVPLRGAAGPFGVLSFATARSGRTLGLEDLALAQDLGARAALALESARLYGEAQRAVRQREDVLAVVSHDLKTPLHAIRLTAELLGRKVAGDPAAAKNAANIGRAAARMDALLRDLLDMASIQAGRLSVEPAPASADEIAHDALELYAPSAQERGLALSREGEGGPVLADRGRVLQVLGNLLGNALKFSPPGGAVTLRLARAPGGVRFAVEDRGPGIAPEDLPRLFEPWWSRRATGGKGERGTGLGLFIARGIVEAHGARLEVDTAPGRGATFSFTLAERRA